MFHYQKTSGLVLLCLLSAAYAQAQKNVVDIQKETAGLINEQRNAWFKKLDGQVIAPYPKKGSVEAEADRLAVLDKLYNSSAERQALATADKNEDDQHVVDVFAQSALQGFGGQTQFQSSDGFKQITKLYQDGTSPWDESIGQNRSFAFILKEKYKRGRPYQVLDHDHGGVYKAGYELIKGSSFPSGHTDRGFSQAVATALVLPERGKEIFSRAIQYGESRVVLGVHFATDTMASRSAHYYYMANLLNNDQIAQNIAALSQDVRQQLAAACDGKLRDCLAPLANPIADEHQKNGYGIGYYDQLKPGQAAIKLTPNHLPKEAGALLRLRFAYLDDAARRQILAASAYPSNSLAQMGDIRQTDQNWGLINLPDAYDGPQYFYTDFKTLNQPETDLDLAQFAQNDHWGKDISGPGKLYMNHQGHLRLSGHNTFAAVVVNQGELLLTGQNALTEDSVVNGGLLGISGGFDSAIQVNQQGRLALLDGQTQAENKVAKVHLNGVDTQLLVQHQGAKRTASIATLSGTGRVVFDTRRPNYQTLALNELTGNVHFFMNTDLNQGLGDKVLIKKGAGEHQLTVADSGAEITQTDEQTVDLVRDQSGGAAFDLVSAGGVTTKAVDGGSYLYYLKARQDQEGKVWYLSNQADGQKTTASAHTKAILALAAAPKFMFHNELNNLQIRQQMLKEQPGQVGVWARSSGGKTNVAHADTQFKLSQNTLEAGVDTVLAHAGGQTILGLFASMGKGDVKHPLGGTSRLDSNSAGVYASYLNPNGWYVDGVLKYNRFKHKLRAQATNGSAMNGGFRQNGWGGALEWGYQAQHDGYVVTPYARVAYLKLNDSHVTQDGERAMQAKIENQASLQGEVGVQLGTQLAYRQAQLMPYLKLAVAHEFEKGNKVLTNDRASWDNDVSGTVAKVGLGLNSQVGKQTNVFAELNYVKGSKIEAPLGFNLGVKYGF